MDPQAPRPGDSESTVAGRDDFSTRLNRRRLLVVAAQGAAAATAAGGLLAACGGGSSSATSASGTTASATAKKGGTMTVGMIGNGTAETVNPLITLVPVDFMRVVALYDNLWVIGSDVSSTVPRLVHSADASADAKTWTIHLREGVEWHDGKPLTADDVVYTVKAWGRPSSVSAGSLAEIIDFKRVRKVGPLSVEIPLQLSVAEFPSLVSVPGLGVIQNGATAEQLAKHPIGTGPYKFKSFTPGQQSIFVANDNYWAPGPAIDELVVQSSFSDPTALTNSLLSQTVQVIPNVSFLEAKQQESSSQVNILRASSPNSYYFSMRVDKPPFDNVQVRQAMRLIADRQALVDGALAGYGHIGNDLMGEDAKYFASNLHREQDIEQAKSLLKSAGAENLTVTLQSSSASPGMLEAGTLLAQQAKAAGVTINVENVDPNNYYTEAGGWLTRVFGENKNGVAYPSLTSAYLTQLWTGAPYNDGHWGEAPGESDKPLFRAIGTLDPGKAKEAWMEVQEQHFEEGPYLIWGNADFVDLTTPDVVGLKTTAAGPLNNYDFTRAGLA